jgi:heat shock protein HslJ
MIKKILVVAALGASVAFGQASLKGVTWRCISLYGTSVGSRIYTITFTTDSTASGTVDCNSCGWGYKVSGQSITIKDGMCTMMACSDGSRDGEYLTMLTSVDSFTLNESMSNLDLNKNGATAGFFASGLQPGLVGTSWQLQSVWQAAGRTNIPMPLNYTISFQASEKAAVKADCNTCNGTYVADVSTGALGVSGISCTKMLCGADSKDQLYLTVLGNVTSYTINGDTLLCYAIKDTLVLRPTSATVAGSNALSGAAAAHTKSLNVSVNGHVLMADAGGRHIASARLLTISGACVRSGHSTARSIAIDASGLPAGMYLLQATLSTGGQLMRRVELIR